MAASSPGHFLWKGRSRFMWGRPPSAVRGAQPRRRPWYRVGSIFPARPGLSMRSYPKSSASRAVPRLPGGTTSRPARNLLLQFFTTAAGRKSYSVAEEKRSGKRLPREARGLEQGQTGASPGRRSKEFHITYAVNEKQTATCRRTRHACNPGSSRKLHWLFREPNGLKHHD